MKKQYSQPTTLLEHLHIQHSILISSNVTDIDGNADITFGGGGSTESRVKSEVDKDWDIWENEE